LKVLTRWSRYIKQVVVPKFGARTSSADERKEIVPPMQRTEEPTIMPKEPSVELVETKADKDKAERSKTKEVIKMPGILSPSTEATVLKAQKSSATTPKRRRMVNVLERTDSISPAPTGKVAEADKTQPKADSKQIEIEATITQADTEAGPTVPAETKLATTERGGEGMTPDTNIAFEKNVAKEAESLTFEAPSEDFDYIIQHAAGKRLSEEEIFEAKHYAQELKYPKGALVFNGTKEDDFLYCLLDNKELSVCREMARSMSFSKLKAGLCAMTKADLADSLAYNSLKVQRL
jgi:hypothetical protein